MGTQFLWGNQFCRTTELSAPSFCISISKISRMQILCHSTFIHSTCLSSGYFHFLKIPQIKEGDLISWGQPILQNHLILSPPLYLKFKNFKDANSTSSHFNTFYMIQQWFSPFFKILQN